jgi:hypothetical protein
MKKSTKQMRQKLLLSKETLRPMSAKELRQVMGASVSCVSCDTLCGGPTADCTYEC